MVATSVASRMPPQTKRGAGGTWTLARSYIYLFIYLSIYTLICLFIYLFLCLSIFLLLFKYIYNIYIYILFVYFCLFSCSFIYSFYLFICWFIYLLIYWFICLSICFLYKYNIIYLNIYVAYIPYFVGQTCQKKQMGQRTQKQDGAQHAFFKKSRGVGSCALYQTDVRS